MHMFYLVVIFGAVQSKASLFAFPLGRLVQVDACREEHRRNFVAHVSHQLKAESFLSLPLSFEELCAISRVR